MKDSQYHSLSTLLWFLVTATATSPFSLWMGAIGAGLSIVCGIFARIEERKAASSQNGEVQS